MNRSAASCDRPAYPEFEQEFGEDPARFLHADLNPWPRLRAITDIELLRAYAHVEAQRETSRKELLGQINERIEALRENESIATASGRGGQR